jgi:hypothetical protein
VQISVGKNLMSQNMGKVQYSSTGSCTGRSLGRQTKKVRPAAHSRF